MQQLFLVKKSIFLLNKECLYKDHLHNVVEQLEQQSEPTGGKNKYFDCTIGPTSKPVFSISLLETKTWENRAEKRQSNPLTMQ